MAAADIHSAAQQPNPLLIKFVHSALSPPTSTNPLYVQLVAELDRLRGSAALPLGAPGSSFDAAAARAEHAARRSRQLSARPTYASVLTGAAAGSLPPAALAGGPLACASPATEESPETLALLARLPLAPPAEQVMAAEEQGEQLRSLLQALTACVACVEAARHSELVRSVAELPVWRLAPAARQAALEAQVQLAVGCGLALPAMLAALVHSLVPPASDVLLGAAMGAASALASPPGEAWAPDARSARVQEEVVAALGALLQLAPLAAARAAPLLAQGFPHRLRERNVLCLHLRGVCLLCEARGGAALRDGLLAAAWAQLLTLDVDIRWEDIVQGPEAREEQGGEAREPEPDIFELEGAEDGGELGPCAGSDGEEEQRGWGGGAASKAPAPPSLSALSLPPDAELAGPAPVVSETADKLDSLMEVLLRHVASRALDGSLPAAAQTLVDAFDQSVLHAHRSKFVQYVLFAACSLDAQRAPRLFLHRLLARLEDQGTSALTRAAAAAYAASFLARAAFVEPEVALDALAALGRWALGYSRSDAERGRGAAVGAIAVVVGDVGPHHVAFYSAVQGLLYVLCYRLVGWERLLRQAAQAEAGEARAGEDAAPAAPSAAAIPLSSLSSALEAQRRRRAASAASPSAAGAPRPLPAPAAALAPRLRHLLADVLPPLLECDLDPLGYCARSVALEFARQCRVLGLGRLARVVRARQLRAAARRPVAAARPLEIFFPFDPYLLRRSAALLRLPETYTSWRRGGPCGLAAGGARTFLAEIAGEGEPCGAEEEEEDGAAEEEEGDGAAEEEEGEGEDARSEASDDSDASSASSSSSSSTCSSSSAEDSRERRFGSVQGSSVSADGWSPRHGGVRAIPSAARRRGRGGRLPLALRASMAAAGSFGGSPSAGLPVCLDQSWGSSEVSLPLGSSPCRDGSGGAEIASAAPRGHDAFAQLVRNKASRRAVAGEQEPVPMSFTS